ncbi:MAG: hypothetical protein H5U24_11570 [Thioclava marina]|uniref:hypothetical protein n=1 Tax=Thioclava marina TaxID=1915077 RepID=UPI0019A918E6|nr:hypothetical protein [Thioclava marina]MBC7146030.1 hypothetical protein [Thioclava marina]
MAVVVKQVEGSSNGFGGDSVFVMTDGSIYRQCEYFYHYRYQYRPKATLIDERQIVLPGIDRAVRVNRLR